MKGPGPGPWDERPPAPKVRGWGPGPPRKLPRRGRKLSQPAQVGWGPPMRRLGGSSCSPTQGIPG
eukprot:5548681-Karenia_brevis.AAC.1